MESKKFYSLIKGTQFFLSQTSDRLTNTYLDLVVGTTTTLDHLSKLHNETCNKLSPNSCYFQLNTNDMLDPDLVI